MGHTPERFAASVAYEGEVKHVPEDGGGKFGQYTEGGTASVAREGDHTKSGYFTFDPGGMYKINWRPAGCQVS